MSSFASANFLLPRRQSRDHFFSFSGPTTTSRLTAAFDRRSLTAPEHREGLLNYVCANSNLSSSQSHRRGEGANEAVSNSADHAPHNSTERPCKQLTHTSSIYAAAGHSRKFVPHKSGDLACFGLSPSTQSRKVYKGC
jgi:hypothetical protein